jgi:threonine dehydratase
MLSILNAARRLRGRVRRTPLVRSAWLSDAARADVWLKLECLQETHAFKIRGALNAILELGECGDTGAAPREVVTASTGNHGRAMAEAARSARIGCTVFTPRQAPRAKLDAIRAAGARLEPVARDCDEAEALARDHARQTGAVYISAYNHPAIIAGAGTIGLEIAEDLPNVDVVVLPMGGGGMASGIGTVMRAFAPACRTVGVEASCNPAFREARAHGAITPIAVAGASLADGLTGNLEPGAITFPIVERVIDDLVDVDEGPIGEAIAEFLAAERLVVEGAGAVTAAALASGALDVRDTSVVAIVSGANIDTETLAALLAARRG